MSGEFEHILYDPGEDGILTITINRPDKLNALSMATIDELDVAFGTAEADDSVRVIIITGAGEKAFVSGADISELVDLDATSGTGLASRGQRVFRRLESMAKPSIAAINGFALGGGCELAMACSMRVASDTARLGLPEVSLGLIPGYGGTQRLARLVGRGVAMEMTLTGAAIDAAEAYRIGLVNRVVPKEDVLDTARRIARRIMRNGPLAIRAAMEAINRGLDMTLEDGCRHESTLFGLLCTSDDMHEGLRAFIDGRKPIFKGS